MLSLSSGSKTTSEWRFELLGLIGVRPASLVMCLAATHCQLHCHYSCYACIHHSLLNELLEYEEELKREGILDGALAASQKIYCKVDGRALHFFSLIVIPLLDTNQDDIVDRTELLGLQVTFNSQ